jgi:hypothetical protein
MTKHLTLLLFIGLAFWSCGSDEPQICNIMEDESLQSYADENWTLDNWVINRFNPPDNLVNGKSWDNFSKVQSLISAHSFRLIPNEDLENLFGVGHLHNTGEDYCIFDSDSLEHHPSWVDMVTILKDSSFYVGLRSYESWVGGWSDIRENWYWHYVDSLSIDFNQSEIQITSPMREIYREMFPSCE